MVEKTEKDIENIKVELIDILHFVISNLLSFFTKKIGTSLQQKLI